MFAIAQASAPDFSERGELTTTSIPLVAEEGVRRSFSLAIDSSERLVVANGELHLYDGYRMIQLPLPTTMPVGAVDVDRRDRIWTGNRDTLGYFERDGYGHWIFHSITDQLPAPMPEYDQLWQVHCVGEVVYFVTSQHLLVWRKGEFQIHHLPNNRRLFSSATPRYCYLWQRVEIYPLPETPDLNVYLWKFDEDGAGQRVLHHRRGFFGIGVLDDTNGSFDLLANDLRRVRSDGKSFWHKPEPQSSSKSPVAVVALPLPGGDSLVGTANRGVMRLAPDDTVRWQANAETKELPDNGTETLVIDRLNRAWTVTPRGLQRIDVHGAITRWPGEHGWPSAVHAITRADSTLLLGTSQGLRTLARSTTGHPAGIDDSILINKSIMPFALTASPHLSWIAAGMNYGYSPGLQYSVTTSPFATGRAVFHLENDSHLLIVGEAKLLLVRQDPATLPKPSGSLDPWPLVWKKPLESLYRAYPGKGGEVYVTSVDGDVQRYDLQRTATEVRESKPVQSLTPSGRLGPVVNGQQVGDRFYAFTRHAAWSVSSTETAFSRVRHDGGDDIVPFALQITDQDRGWAVAELRARWHSSTADPIYGVFSIKLAEDGTITGFRQSPAGVFNRLGLLISQFQDEDVWWLGGTGGLARIDLRILAQQPPISLAGAPRFDEATGERGEALLLGSSFTLSEARNVSLGFSYSRHMHDLPVKLESRLLPVESGWTEHLQDSRQRDLTDLRGGDYTFELRAVDLAGQTSETVRWGFQVQPRFSETWLYPASFALAGVLSIAAGLLWWIRQLRRRRDELALQIAERTTALVEANQELHRLNARRVEFIGAISHELRTPLLGATLLAQQQAANPNASIEAKRLSRCLDDLQAMLEGTMDLSRYELGLIPVKLRWQRLHEILPQTCDVFRPLAASKGVAIQDESPALPDCGILIDFPNFRRIAHNLISNAVKFTSAGEIRLRVSILPADSEQAERLELRVTDTGAGMTPEQKNKLFAEFQRTVWRGGADEASHGLGLALTKRLVDLAGGEVLCASEPGVGSEFTVRIPTVTSGAAQPEPPFDFSAWLIEDERSHAEHAQDILEPLGGTIRCIEKLADLVAPNPSNRPDVVFVDFNLPDGTGLDVITRLRSAWDPEPRWVLVSAIHSPPMIEMCLAAGFDAVLPKPLSVGAAIRQIRLLRGMTDPSAQ